MKTITEIRLSSKKKTQIAKLYLDKDGYDIPQKYHQSIAERFHFNDNLSIRSITFSKFWYTFLIILTFLCILLSVASVFYLIETFYSFSIISIPLKVIASWIIMFNLYLINKLEIERYCHRFYRNLSCEKNCKIKLDSK